MRKFELEGSTTGTISTSATQNCLDIFRSCLLTCHACVYLAASVALFPWKNNVENCWQQLEVVRCLFVLKLLPQTPTKCVLPLQSNFNCDELHSVEKNNVHLSVVHEQDWQHKILEEIWTVWGAPMEGRHKSPSRPLRDGNAHPHPHHRITQRPPLCMPAHSYAHVCTTGAPPLVPCRPSPSGEPQHHIHRNGRPAK